MEEHLPLHLGQAKVEMRKEERRPRWEKIFKEADNLPLREGEEISEMYTCETSITTAEHRPARKAVK